jgi:uracil-DNA glycosylase
MLSQNDYQKNLADSVIAWWRDAGVDYVCDDQTTDWLATPAVQIQIDAPIAIPVGCPASPTVQIGPVAAPSRPAAEWPADIAALQSALASGANLPGSGYGSRCLPPIGGTGATAMIISDCPEVSEIDAGSFGNGPAATLLQNMLLAAGLVPDLCYQSALALSRPATGSLPKGDLPNLAAFVQHQIALVQPQILVILGTTACETLLSHELMRARGNLHYVNHNDRKTAAVATFHPRTLLVQPQLKGQAWKDLQMLSRNDCL